jgi:preprotein translocase subunit SecF
LEFDYGDLEITLLSMIRFSKYIWLYFLISALIIVPGILSLFINGLRPSIDFSGGSLLELKNEVLTKQTIEQKAEEFNIPIVSIQETNTGSYIIRVKSEETEKLTSGVAKLISLASTPSAVLRNEIVGPVLGRELLQKTVVAALFVMVGIICYVAYSFKDVKYGIAAVVALIHDLLVVIGMFSLFGAAFGVEVDTLFVTAILTTMSFSVHDTIVVFHRIREMQSKGESGSFEDLADKALTQTMSRSLANSVTIIIMLLALVLLGGTTIQWFAMALLIGTISGTYSSPFVATPVLILLNRRRKKKS